MERYLIDRDPITGEECYAHFDDDGNVRVEHSVPMSIVSKILDGNRAMANDEERTKDGIKHDWWHYARIPNVVALKWLNEHGVNIYDKAHEKEMFKLLNHPDYRYLKTTTKVHA